MNCFVFKNEKRKDIYRWYIESADVTISTLCFEILFASQQNITNEKLLLTGYLASLSQGVDKRKVKTLFTNLFIEEKFKEEFENCFLTVLKCPHQVPNESSHVLKDDFTQVLRNHNMVLDAKVKSTENVLYIWTTNQDESLDFPKSYKTNCLCGNMESMSAPSQEKFKQLDMNFKRTQVLFYEILEKSGSKEFSLFFFSFIPLLYFMHDYISEVVCVSNNRNRVSVTLSSRRNDCSILLSILQRVDLPKD